MSFSILSPLLVKTFMLLIHLICYNGSFGLPQSTSESKDIVNLSHDPNDVTFFLYPDKIDLDSMDEIVYDNVASLLASRFNADLPTILIIHGFRSGMYSEINVVLKHAFLKSDLDVNIIVVDWLPLSLPIPAEYALNTYDRVIPNLPIVGQRVAEFILFLQKEGKTTLDKVHLIGHSLGSHVSGIAGKVVFNLTGDKIGRISGLDPAFPALWPKKPERNLMKEDAHFVDVIHTNMGKLGSITEDGHADFYPNGGLVQPGCENLDKLPNMIGRCSHQQAYLFYASSIMEKMHFNACPCNLSYPLPMNVTNKTCPLHCDNSIHMGYHCPHTARGQYYLSTSNSPVAEIHLNNNHHT